MRLLSLRNPARLAILGVLTIAAGACELEDARISFFFGGSSVEAIDGSGLVIRFTDGSGRRVVRRNDLRARPSNPEELRSTEFETDDSGSLHVDVLLEDLAGRPVVGGIVELRLQPNWRYSVGISVGDRNPTVGCFGCIGYVAFPLREDVLHSPTDSLFVWWGGNSISNPVVF